MKAKWIAVVVILGAALAFAAANRLTSSAGASPSDCYSDAAGPSTPTICE